MKPSLIIVFSLCAICFGAISVSASELPVPPLRAGSVICDTDPSTSRRAIYLPSYLEIVTEEASSHGPPTVELVGSFLPPKFSSDGVLLHKAIAMTLERPDQAYSYSISRYVVLAPTKIGYLNTKGEAIFTTTYRERDKRDESAIMRTINEIEDSVISPPQNWNDVRDRYEAYREGKISDRYSYSRERNIYSRVHSQTTLPKTISPKIPKGLRLLDLKIDRDAVFSAVVLPPVYKTVEMPEYISWEAYAVNAKNRSALGYSCDGSKLVKAPVALGSMPKYKFPEPKSIRAIEAELYPEGYMFFNVYGEYLSAKKLEENKDSSWMAYAAKITEKRWADSKTNPSMRSTDLTGEQ